MGRDVGEIESNGTEKDASTGSYASGSITHSKYGRDVTYGIRASSKGTYFSTGESTTSTSTYAFVFDAFT